MKKSILYTIILAYSILLCACNKKTNDLENALIMAGENRYELEKVLSHYSQHPEDTLKYKAACFLIENMPEHHSYKDSLYINRYYQQLDSVADIYKDQHIDIKDRLFRQITKEYNQKMEVISDIQIMQANYLIENIDRSFEAWLNGEWSQHLDFDEFCEYILPYKSCETQMFDNWREYFHDYCNANIKKHKYSLLLKNAAFNACEAVNRALKKDVKPRIINESHIPIRKMNTLTQIPFGLCGDYNILALSVMRAKGIPTAMDYTPQWPFRSLGHSWNILIETSGKTVIYEGANGNPGTPHKEEHPMAKVFRNTYAINKELQNMREKEKHIPPTFNNVCIKDVTAEYLKTHDIALSVNLPHKHSYAYLAVFDNQEWIPIHYAQITKKKQVTFDKMGKRIAYLPVFYERYGVQAFADPVLLTISGKQITLTPDTLQKQTLILKRKYPPLENIYKVAERIVGGKFQIATDSLFEDSINLSSG